MPAYNYRFFVEDQSFFRSKFVVLVLYFYLSLAKIYHTVFG